MYIYGHCHCCHCYHCQCQFAFCHNLITTVIMITIAPGPGRPRQGYSGQSSSTFSMFFHTFLTFTFSLYQCCTFSSVPLFHFPLSLHLFFLMSLGITLCTFSPASLHNWLPTGSSVISSFHCLLIFPAGWSVCSKTGLCPLF